MAPTGSTPRRASSLFEPWSPTGWHAAAGRPRSAPRHHHPRAARSLTDVARDWTTACLLSALAGAVLAAFGGPPTPVLWAALSLPVVGAAASAAARVASLPAAPVALLAGAGLRATGWLSSLLGPTADPAASRAVYASRSAASALIFFVAGVELDPRLLAASHPWRLLGAAGVDAVVTGVAAGVVLGLPPALAAALGAVATAAGPSLAVPLAASLVQARRGAASRVKGYGASTAVGLPELLVSASAFSEASSLSLFAFLFGSGSAALRGAAPPSIGAAAAAGFTSLGVALGAGAAAAAFLFSVTRLLRTPTLIAAAAALTTAAVKGGLDATGHVAAGDLAAVVAGVCVKALWARGLARGGGTAAPTALRPRRALPRSDVAAVQQALGAVWFAIGAPLLFSCAGACINAHALDGPTLARAAAVVAAAGAARVAATLALTALGPCRLPLGEAAYVTAAFASRATLQIALSSVAAAAAAGHKHAAGGTPPPPLPPAVAHRVNAWQTTLIVCALVWSIVPTLAARGLARWVRRDGDENDEEDVAASTKPPSTDARATLVAAIDAALHASLHGGDEDEEEESALRAARAALELPPPLPTDRLLGGDDFLRAVRRTAGTPHATATVALTASGVGGGGAPRRPALALSADARARRATVD